VCCRKIIDLENNLEFRNPGAMRDSIKVDRHIVRLSICTSLGPPHSLSFLLSFNMLFANAMIFASSVPDPYVFGPPGSTSGSVSQRYGSEDPYPDPHQNVTDPQHWIRMDPLYCVFWVQNSCV
jgi:hypothetical protein